MDAAFIPGYGGGTAVELRHIPISLRLLLDILYRDHRGVKHFPVSVNEKDNCQTCFNSAFCVDSLYISMIVFLT
jgi:hypothetical protein